MQAGSICLGRSHLAADHLENLTAELFHCILPVATVSKKVMHNFKIEEERGDKTCRPVGRLPFPSCLEVSAALQHCSSSRPRHTCQRPSHTDLQTWTHLNETLPKARMKLESLGCLFGAAEAIPPDAKPLKGQHLC